MVERGRERRVQSGGRAGEWGQSVWGTTGRGAVRLRRGRASGFGGDAEWSGDPAVSQRGGQAGSAREGERAAGQPAGNRGTTAREPWTTARTGSRDSRGRRVLVGGQRGAGDERGGIAGATRGSLARR